MRTFEIPSMGGLMLTTRSNEQNKFFPENKASLMFKDIQELNKKIKYILNNKNISKKIRQKSYLLSKKHSYEQRIKSLIRYIDKYEKFYIT
jgi:spore maturation protein CgeB